MLFRAGVDWLDDNDLQKRPVSTMPLSTYPPFSFCDLDVSYLLAGISSSCNDGHSAYFEDC